MTFNTGDCLIEVTAWAGLTVYHCDLLMSKPWSIDFTNYNGDVIASVLALSAVDHDFKLPWQGQAIL